MDEREKEIQYALEHTEVLRPPKQRLATFGSTTIYYYLLTEPIYQETLDAGKETVVREGRVLAERPRLITPSYLRNLFEGFEHGRQYADYVLRRYGPHEPGLLYRYKNESKEVNIVSNDIRVVAHNLGEEIDRAEDPLRAIVKGIDALWDICLMKFIHDLTRSSMPGNVMELEGRGLLEMDHLGIPREARIRIEELFERVRRGEDDPAGLKAELERWGVFEEYEDRFLSLFRRKH